MTNHLSRSKTMASDTAQEAPTHNSTGQVSGKEAAIPAQNADKCRFCKRPKCCPTCNTKLDPDETTKGAVNVDAKIDDIFNQLPCLPKNLGEPHKHFKTRVPPEQITRPKDQPIPPSVFLAGSIEMGKAVQWQRHLYNYLQDLPIEVFNPRRGHWDPNVTAEAKHLDFRRQVNWEWEALKDATVICFFFDHETMSPVTMLELGKWLNSDKVVVCCDKRFWKGGNIHLVCEYEKVPLAENFTDLVGLIRAKLRKADVMVDKDGNLIKDEKLQDTSRLPTLEEAKRILDAAIPKSSA